MSESPVLIAVILTKLNFATAAIYTSLKALIVITRKLKGSELLYSAIEMLMF
jgi:hypothetical protein